MSQDIENQIKAAELAKLLLEAEKLKAEKEKLQNEAKALEKANNTQWWQKSETWKPFVAIFLGVGFLSFYIVYIVDPLAEIKVNQLTDQNHQLTAQNLELQINNDNVRLELLKGQLKYYTNLLGSQRSLQIHSAAKGKQVPVDSLPNITGIWLSTLYNGQESWQITRSDNKNSFSVILKTPDGSGDGLAIYKGKGNFMLMVNFQGTNRSLQLEYTWTVNDLKPRAINSIFVVKKSNDPRTPVGIKQSDVLIMKEN